MIDFDWLSEQLVYILRWQLDRYPGAMETDPDAPEMPTAGLRVWGIFLGLCTSRTSSGFGVNPISHGEIEAYSRVRREPIRPFELDIIRALDAAYLEVMAEMAKNPDRPKVSSEKLTPQLFSRLFG